MYVRRALRAHLVTIAKDISTHLLYVKANNCVVCVHSKETGCFFSYFHHIAFLLCLRIWSHSSPLCFFLSSFIHNSAHTHIIYSSTICIRINILFLTFFARPCLLPYCLIFCASFFMCPLSHLLSFHEKRMLAVRTCFGYAIICVWQSVGCLLYIWLCIAKIIHIQRAIKVEKAKKGWMSKVVLAKKNEKKNNNTSQRNVILWCLVYKCAFHMCDKGKIVYTR